MVNEATTKGTGSASGWTSTQAYVMAVICLLIGLAVGYLLRGSSAPATAPTTAGTGAAPQLPNSMGQTQITPEQLKHMADKQAEPLLSQLKSTPNDPALLANLGNLYYDAQQYQEAINYYDRSLKIQPMNTDVRTDMGTAYWYLGNADRAIAEFNTVLSAEPNKASTLMNLGIVKWQGKMDVEGAVSAWEKLLQTNPSYPERSQVESLIANARKHSNIKPGTKTEKPL